MTTPTGNPYIDAISWGTHTAGKTKGDSTVVKVCFSNKYSKWNWKEKKAFKKALKEYSEVANIEFKFVKNPKKADLVEYSLTNKQMKKKLKLDKGDGIGLGQHQTPDKKGVQKGYFNNEAYSLPSHGVSKNKDGLKEGGYGYLTFIHEIGHALGLAHPHDTGGGSNLWPGIETITKDFANPYDSSGGNHSVFTVMSYNGGDPDQNPQKHKVSKYGYNSTISAIDIAAIQNKYGAVSEANSGDNVYMLGAKSWSTIWDTGGIDEIRYDGDLGVRIDLRSVSLSPTMFLNSSLVLSGAEQREKAYGGLTIARDFTNVIADEAAETGVLIENATGGEGDDVIQGNSLYNILKGNGGNDTFYASAGADLILAGEGDDTIKLSSSVSIDEIENYFGEGGQDKIHVGREVYDFSNIALNSFEIIEFTGRNPDDHKIVAHFSAQNFTTLGYDALEFLGSGAFFQIDMNGATELDLSYVNFGDGLHIEYVTSDQDEHIIGSGRADHFSTNGGADHFIGGLGDDELLLLDTVDLADFIGFDGGEGSDTLIVQQTTQTEIDLRDLVFSSVETVQISDQGDASVGTVNLYFAAEAFFASPSPQEAYFGLDSKPLSDDDFVIHLESVSGEALDATGLQTADLNAGLQVQVSGSDQGDRFSIFDHGAALRSIQGNAGDDQFVFDLQDNAIGSLSRNLQLLGGEGIDSLVLTANSDAEFSTYLTEIAEIERLVFAETGAKKTMLLHAPQIEQSANTSLLQLELIGSSSVDEVKIDTRFVTSSIWQILDASGWTFASWGPEDQIVFVGTSSLVDSDSKAIGTILDDTFIGNVAGQMYGGDGNDSFFGSEGVIDGGDGIDTFYFTGQNSNFSFTNIEKFVFDDASGALAARLNATSFDAALNGGALEIVGSSAANRLIIEAFGDFDLRDLPEFTNWGRADQTIELRGREDNITLTGTESDDVVSLTANGDVFALGGNDTIIFNHSVFEGTLDGGAGIDRLQIFSFGDLRFFQLASIEELDVSGSIGGNIKIWASQFGAGQLSDELLVIGTELSGYERLSIYLGDESSVDLSGLQFSNWGRDSQLIEFYGDDDSETFRGTSQNDIFVVSGGMDVFIFGANSGNDKIFGFEKATDKLDFTLFNFASEDDALSKFYEIGTADDDVVGFNFDGTSIEINGVDLSDIDAGDIII